MVHQSHKEKGKGLLLVFALRVRGHVIFLPLLGSCSGIELFIKGKFQVTTSRLGVGGAAALSRPGLLPAALLALGFGPPLELSLTRGCSFLIS